MLSLGSRGASATPEEEEGKERKQERKKKRKRRKGEMYLHGKVGTSVFKITSGETALVQRIYAVAKCSTKQEFNLRVNKVYQWTID